MGKAFLVALFALSACSTSDYTADLSYVRASGLGYRNAGLFSAGYLFLWKTGENQLVQLENNIPLEKVSPAETPTNLRSSSVSGVSIRGEFGSPLEKVSAEAGFSRRVEFSAEDAFREKYKSTITGLSNAYKQGIVDGEDMKARWHVDEATAKGSDLRYVLVTELVRANKATALVGGKSGSEIGKIAVQLPGVGSIDVSVDRGSAADCSGDHAPCFFEPTVLKPFINANGNLDFKVDTDAPRKNLPAALQNL